MKLVFALLLISLLWIAGFAQIRTATLVKIVKAEDARAYDKSLDDLIKTPNSAVQTRAILAAGRIGDDKAVPVLTALLEKEQSEQVRAMAAFALGEIESIKAAADAILKALKAPEAETRPVGSVSGVRARLVEAAGKIAAANPKEERSKDLGAAILDTLKEQEKLGAKRGDRDVVLLALTAALRAKPADADATIAKFLTDADARIRADAANALARLKAKNANETLCKMLARDTDAVARASAARTLGAAEDKDALDILLKAATGDADSRVRVSAIRALGSLKDAKAADKLLERGKTLMGNYQYQKTENRREKNECLELATTLGRLMPGTKNEKAVKFLSELTKWGLGRDPEVAIAWATIDPQSFLQLGSVTVPQDPRSTGYDWHVMSSQAQGLAVLAKSDDKDSRKIAADRVAGRVEYDKTARLWEYLSIPDDLQALAEFKPADLDATMRTFLKYDDILIRATAAGILADQPPSNENADALRFALDLALKSDKHDNDAQLAIMDALVKVAGRNSISEVSKAIYSPDYLVRKKALELLQQFPGWSDTPVFGTAKVKMVTVQPFNPKSGTKLGQVLNTEADYRRALGRKNGTVKAVLTTEKGTFTIVFNPEEAPLTVDNFIKLARANYFNGVEVHRVVPNFVMQDGDPRGDGNGGPGWSIRCEVNIQPYDRGAVGMALSGKDTGGSQWFVTHAPQPHLDGGYTVFGHVNETGMKVVDTIVRGDKIISVKIVEGNSPQRTQRTQRK